MVCKLCHIQKPIFMNFKQNQYAPSSNKPIMGSYIEKDPDEWITGTEKMSREERTYLKTLSDKAGETFDETISKAAAYNRIENLQHKMAKL
jgi:Protein of unknown function (DUF3072)